MRFFAFYNYFLFLASALSFRIFCAVKWTFPLCFIFYLTLASYLLLSFPSCPRRSRDVGRWIQCSGLYELRRMEEDILIYFSFKLNFYSFYEDSDRMTFLCHFKFRVTPWHFKNFFKAQDIEKNKNTDSLHIIVYWAKNKISKSS